jgi:hypothetical protein
LTAQIFFDFFLIGKASFPEMVLVCLMAVLGIKTQTKSKFSCLDTCVYLSQI